MLKFILGVAVGVSIYAYGGITPLASMVDSSVKAGYSFVSKIGNKNASSGH